MNFSFDPETQNPNLADSRGSDFSRDQEALEAQLTRLERMVTSPCSFNHHFSWRNGGMEGDICPDSIRENTLLCAHNNRTVLYTAINAAYQHGLLDETHAQQLRDVLNKPFLLKADVTVGTLSKLAAHHDESCPYDVRQMQALLSASEVFIPAQAITQQRTETLACQLQLYAGTARQEIHTLLIDLFRIGTDRAMSDRNAFDEAQKLIADRITGILETAHQFSRQPLIESATTI